MEKEILKCTKRKKKNNIFPIMGNIKKGEILC